MKRYGLIAARRGGAGRPALADEESIELKDGPGARQGREQLRCVPQPRLHRDEFAVPRRAKWEATVKKMIRPFGAPIEDKDVAAIVDYLTANYGAP